MKKELKISTLSIVCVLCTTIAMPSFGASAVRSIGGAGTYSSASSAATAGSKSSSGATGAVRAGALRATGAKSATASSARVASTPRLSIGKYLGGATVSGSGGSSSGTINPGQSASGNLQARIEVLEEFVGFTETGTLIKDTVADLVIDVEQLQEDLNDMTDGGYRISVEEKDGKLTINQGDNEIWSGEFATVEGLTDLQDVLDALTDRVSVNEAAIATLEAGLESLKATVDDLGDIASDDLVQRVADLETTVKGLQSGGASGEVVSQLQEDVEALNSQVESVVGQLANAATKEEIKDFITSSAVDAKVQDLATKAEIADLVSNGELQTEIAKLATKSEIANFMNSTQVSDAIANATKDLLTADDIADFVKSGDMATAITNATSSLATKQELANAKSELQAAIDQINAGNVELTNYYTKAEMDAKFVDVQDSVDANTAGVAENAADIVSLESAVQAAASEAADAKLAAGTAQNMADLNAADIKELQDAGYITAGALTEYAKRTELSAVATSGSYNDLTDKPDLTQYVTETQVEQSVNTAINAYEIPDGSITAAKIQSGAITSDKINTEAAAGEMVMLMSNGDGTSSWVSVTVDE